MEAKTLVAFLILTPPKISLGIKKKVLRTSTVGFALFIYVL